MNMRDVFNRWLCRVFGHDRESYYAGDAFRMDDCRRRPRYYSRCRRCRTSEGSEVFRPGLFEWATPSNLDVVPLRLRYFISGWWRTEFSDCGKPTVRCGRSQGNHGNCLPF